MLIHYLIIITIIICWLRGIQAQEVDDMFQEYAHNSLPTHPRTGVLYNASSSLPSNFTGIQVSIVRLRRDSFQRKGANYSGFQFPPNISFHFPFPFPSKRIDIIFSNLANYSSFYYNHNVPPNYILVAPVVAFNAYAQIANFTKLNLTLFGDPILLQFPLPQMNQKAKCVAFYSNGTSEITNMTLQDMCTVRDQGHFSLLLPKAKKRAQLWKWWVFGFALGVFGLLFFGFLILVIIKLFRMRKIGKMEKEAEKNEGLDTAIVGLSKMPLATVVRTQPAIENDYFP